VDIFHILFYRRREYGFFTPTAIGSASVLGTSGSLQNLYWGPTYTGINWGILLIAPALGGVAMTLFATYPLDENCWQANCFNNIFIVSSGLGSIALILFISLVLFHKRNYWLK